MTSDRHAPGLEDDDVYRQENAPVECILLSFPRLATIARSSLGSSLHVRQIPSISVDIAEPDSLVHVKISHCWGTWQHVYGSIS
ncbi:hypothetical protein TNCV_4820171 [Trichonephila clavipes]|nr:hypothetical protein TNCV_4820171 [Trichonephila clavipes]